MVKKYRYLARLYTQHPNSNMSIISFVAKASDIIDWAGVPRKATMIGRNGTLIGFQRVLNEERVEEIDSFFKEPSNLSPTAIVVAFRKGQTTLIRMDQTLKASLQAKEDPTEPVWVEIEVDDFSKLTVSELISLFLTTMEKRLEGEPLEEESVDEAIYDQTDEEFVLHDSHLRKFMQQLQSIKERLDKEGELPEGISENDIRDTLESMLLPAMLVDGQHRVMGALRNDENIPFCVCGLVDATWEEQVFQFVVINQKASRIEPPFLNAIVTTSLTQKLNFGKFHFTSL